MTIDMRGYMENVETVYVKDADCTEHTPVFWGQPEKPIYGKGISIMPAIPSKSGSNYEQKIYLEKLLPLEEYDLFIVLFSGGKDSAASLLRLLELGVPKDKIELWHHDIDGGHPIRRMDWPVTGSYVKAFSEAFEVPLRTSWRVGGFFGELYRVGASYPIEYTDGAAVKTCRLSSAQQRSEELREQILHGYDVNDELKQFGYRMRFPAKSGDFARRWCSAYLKITLSDTVLRDIDALRGYGGNTKFPAKSQIANGRWCSPMLKREVSENAIRNLSELETLGSLRHKFPAKASPQKGRYCSGALKASIQDAVTSDSLITKGNVKILVVSGERRGESIGRAKYNEMELHRTNATAKAHRLVHQWRNVISYTERDTWQILQRHNVNPHPCYSCGWNRCSCAMCIFSLPKHWAGIRELFPEEYAAIRQDEITLGFTLDNKKNLDEYIAGAQSCVNHSNERALKQLTSGRFTAADVFIQKDKWQFPAGAFGGSSGGPC